ncbi:cytochrome c oxidase assembly protein COX18, mitochondrial-like isoform X2 [Anneissia japonica]|nr:cytochrome c oxidase assembly protein COX18, mitochondrial-like isoform X2 [Anneissia japonica]XP_033114164.1 cytochrome c oxidase assembly protein COX18, mitochondrial-like isoform X2 [Anneissia japonica]XP_033114165.1 cytochrome c oxidase assembly protein COX18, mitochondrial-like isoform X2 [Anneissia japonica]
MMVLVVRVSCKHLLSLRCLHSSTSMSKFYLYDEDIYRRKLIKRKPSNQIHRSIIYQSVSPMCYNNIMKCSRMSSGGPSIYARNYSSDAPRTVYENILNSEPVHLAQSVLEYGHSITGLPWWASIVMTTLALRLVMTFPLSVYSQHIRAKIENLQPEIMQSARRIFQQRFAAQAKQQKWNEKRMKGVITKLMQRSAKELYIRDNCHPAKGSLMLLVQIPLWICVSLSLRNMTGAIASNFFIDPAYLVPALSDGGTLWFSNLVLPDPFCVLPVAVGILNLMNVEIHTLTGRKATRFQGYITNLFRGLSILMIPIAAYLPSAISLYWMTSASYSLGQNLFLKLPSVRRVVRIPSSGSDSDTPIQDMKRHLKQKYFKKKTTART